MEKKIEKNRTNLPAGPEIVYDDQCFERPGDLETEEDMEKKIEKNRTNLPAGPEIVYDDQCFERPGDLVDNEYENDKKSNIYENKVPTRTENEPGRLSNGTVSNINSAETNEVANFYRNASNTLITRNSNNVNVGQNTTANANGATSATGGGYNIQQATMVEAYVVPDDEENNNCLPNKIFRTKEGNIKKKCWFSAASLLTCGIITGIVVSTKQSSSSDTSLVTSSSNTPSTFLSLQPSISKSISPSMIPSLQPSISKSISQSNFPSSQPSVFNCIDLCLADIEKADCPNNPSLLISCHLSAQTNLCVDDKKCVTNSNSPTCDTDYQIFRRVKCPIDQPWKDALNGFEFYLEDHLMTWEEHQERAVNFNASLASIQDQLEFNFSTSMISNSDGIKDTYIGGIRKNENGDPLNDGSAKYWKWVDNATWLFTKWDDGEPNGKKATGEYESVVVFNKNLKMEDVFPKIFNQGLYKRKFVGNHSIEIIAGGYHTCALTSIGELYCWGRNYYGQLGDGSTDHKNTPTMTIFENGRKKVYLGDDNSCAVLDDGELQCWGQNNNGQVGDNSTIDKIKPTKINIKGGSSITHMALSDSHTCAVFDDGTMYCWGANSFGQLGDKTKNNKKVPTASIAVEKKVLQVSTGWDHTCVIIQDNSLQCWGYNIFGTLGDGTTVSKTMPTEVSIEGGEAVMQVVTGGLHTCALSVDGMLYCWGYNNDGQLGDGTSTNKLVPQKIIVNNGKKIKKVASMFHTCVISDDDTVWCWGNNLYGQIGDGTTTNRFVPTKIDIGDERAVTQIVVGLYHTCARLDDNAMKCWGGNDAGELGTGTNTSVIDASKAQIITFLST
jgi:alpha-tubulin suppressor-like RCC1 family protein